MTNASASESAHRYYIQRSYTHLNRLLLVADCIAGFNRTSKASSPQYRWFDAQVAGSGNIAGVDIKTAGSRTWAPMTNSYGSVWSASNFGEPPLDLRLTSETGEMLTAM